MQEHTMPCFPVGQAKAVLSGQSRLLLLVSGLFAVANALSGTYVNVFLWKVKSDYALIGWFAASHQVSMAITFWLVGKWVKEHNKMNSLRLGVAVSAMFYCVILWLGPNAVNYVILLGVVQGLASGFFWLAFNVVYFEVTNPQNRDKFNGSAGLLGSGAGMIAPWVSGFLITRMQGMKGYTFIFSLSLAVFVVGVIVSFFLKKRKVQQHYDWLFIFRCLRESHNPWRKVSIAMLAQGMREGVFGFIIGLLVYIYTKNEMKLGNYSLITSAVALFSFMLVGRLLKPYFRKWAMLVGVMMMIVVMVPFFWQISYLTLLVFGIGTALFIPLYTIPVTSTVFDLIGHDEESADLRVEYIVLRELALNTGRFLGTLLFIIVISFSTQPLVIIMLLAGLGSTPIVTWIMLRHWLAHPLKVASDCKQ